MAQSKSFANLEMFSVAVFTLEYLARLWTAPAKEHANMGFVLSCKCRSKYIFSFGGIIDLLSILPFYLRSFFSLLRFKSFAGIEAFTNPKTFKLQLSNGRSL